MWQFNYKLYTDARDVTPAFSKYFVNRVYNIQFEFILETVTLQLEDQRENYIKYL